jgi:hypothetical protein
MRKYLVMYEDAVSHISEFPYIWGKLYLIFYQCTVYTWLSWRCDATPGPDNHWSRWWGPSARGSRPSRWWACPACTSPYTLGCSPSPEIHRRNFMYGLSWNYSSAWKFVMPHRYTKIKWWTTLGKPPV